MKKNLSLLCILFYCISLSAQTDLQKADALLKKMTLEEMEKEMIQRAMDFHKSNVARASRALGLTRAALYRRLEKFGMPFSDEFVD